VSVCNTIDSQWLGKVELDPQCELYFPSGLPGFEDERSIVPIEIPAQRPLVYLQSAANAGICFVALPVFVIKPDFELRLSEEELFELQLSDTLQPVIGEDVLCLALLLPSGETVQTNLNAIVVVNLHNRRGIQCIPSPQSESARLFPLYPALHLTNDGAWTASC
jgi:flagellar assembly factor FliW